MEEINAIAQSIGLAVIETRRRQSGPNNHGSFAGNIGDVGCFSFFPSKNLGGAVTVAW